MEDSAFKRLMMAIPNVFADYKGIKEPKRTVTFAGESIKRRFAKKRKNLLRQRYVERRKSWRRRRKTVAA